MKLFSFLTLCFLMSTRVFSQQNFIEIHVADTVQAKPDLFVYSIMVNDTKNGYDAAIYQKPENDDQSKQEAQKRLARVYDSLKTAIIKRGFIILPYSLSSSVMALDNDDISYTINVLNSSPDSIKMLHNAVSNHRFISGFLRVAKAKNETPYLDVLYKKLIIKAQEKAKTIADVSNQKLGAVYSVAEAKDIEENAGWTAYPPLSQLARSIIPGWQSALQESPDYMITYATAARAGY